MQAVTHLAVGAAISLVLADGRRPSGRRLLAVGGLAALSHALLDDLALATYHPPDPDWGDPFWVGFHAAALALAVYVAWRLRAHWVGMLGALIPDLDWVVGRPLSLWDPGAAHAWFRSLPGLEHVSEGLRGLAPDLRFEPAAALVEGAPVFLLLVWCLRQVRRREALTDTPPGIEETCAGGVPKERAEGAQSFSR